MAATGRVAFGLIGCFPLKPWPWKKMEQILCGQLNAAGFLALLCLAKIITTSLTAARVREEPSRMFIGACLADPLAMCTA